MSADVPPSVSPIYPRTISPWPLPQLFRLRAGLFVFGLFLGLCGAWLLVPELLKPMAIELARDRNAAAAVSTYQPGALQAAEIARIRGDLWAQAAFADSALLWQARQAQIDRGMAARLSQARSSMEAGLALAPINGEGWLFLALLPATSASADSRVATLLEMSYLTAPSAVELAPLRIERAAASSALADKTMQELVKSDMRLILAYRPQLKSAIISAYRNAWPQNQPVFEELVDDVDPVFAQSLRAGQPK